MALGALRGRRAFWENRLIDGADLELRNATYRLFVELGRAPTAGETGLEVGLDPDDVCTGWERLHDAHALVLDAETREIRMANPFSAVSTPFRVEADGRRWFANCAWDAFGVCAALGVDGHIETTCADCDEPIEVRVSDGHPDDATLVFHCLVPAAQWWDDIVFT